MTLYLFPKLTSNKNIKQSIYILLVKGDPTDSRLEATFIQTVEQFLSNSSETA